MNIFQTFFFKIHFFTNIFSQKISIHWSTLPKNEIIHSCGFCRVYQHHLTDALQYTTVSTFVYFTDISTNTLMFTLGCITLWYTAVYTGAIHIGVLWWSPNINSVYTKGVRSLQLLWISLNSVGIHCNTDMCIYHYTHCVVH